MRFAYMTSQYPAPSHTFISREVAELRRQGMDVHTFSVRPPGVTKYGQQADPTTYYLLPFRPALFLRAHLNTLLEDPTRYCQTLWLALNHRVPGMRALWLACCYFLESMVLADELRRRQVRHVHNHFANPSATVSMLATRYLGLTWSLTLHGNSEFDYPAGNLLAAKLEMCDFAACVSHFGRAQAYRSLGPAHWHKVFISRCGLDLLSLPRVSPRIPGAPLRIVCVARLSPEKGLAGLLQAFGAARFAANSELVLIGDGPDRATLEGLAKNFGLASFVIFKGALPEQETLQEIAASDIVVLSSLTEGLPVVLMEAMALGKPVIAPRLAGIPELVEDGVSGLLFNPADWVDLNGALETLLGDRELRERFASTGRRAIEEEFEITEAVAPLRERFALLASQDLSDPLAQPDSSIA